MSGNTMRICNSWRFIFAARQFRQAGHSKRLSVHTAVALACTVSIVVAMGDRVRASIVVDQSQLDVTLDLASFDDIEFAQSFKQSSGNITGARVSIHSDEGSGSGAITIDLYDDLPSNGGTQLATGTDFGVGPGDWASVDFGGQVSVIPNSLLYLVFSSTNSSFSLSGSNGNPYSRGRAFLIPDWGMGTTHDYTFETFANSAPAVPEPSTFALAFLGLLSLGFCGWRRRRR